MPKETISQETMSAKENKAAQVTLNCLINKARATKLAIGKYTR